MQEFSEWAQCQVLEFAAQYQPKDEEEVYGIMNVLDDRLSHSNTAVVMGCVKLFLHLTLRLPATHQLVSVIPAPTDCLCHTSCSCSHCLAMLSKGKAKIRSRHQICRFCDPPRQDMVQVAAVNLVSRHVLNVVALQG